MRTDSPVGHPRFDAATIVAAALFALAVTIAAAALELKREALGYHPRDYNYFIEMAARLADPGLTDRYTTNIEGFNVAGLQGIEGVKSIYHAIHAEYYRWVNVLLYGLFGDVRAIYLAFSLLYFTPLVYAAWVFKRSGGKRWDFLALFLLLYALFPGAVAAIGADMRSRVLFSAFWCLAVTAVYFDRPWLEKLFFLAALPFIREEGILLGAIVTGLNFVRMRGKPGRRAQTLVFSLLLGAAAAAFAGFMVWGGYNRVDNLFNPLNILARLGSSPAVWGAGLLAAAALTLAWRAARRSPRAMQLFWFWLIYSAVIALAGVQFWRDISGWLNFARSLGAVSAWDVYLKVITWEQSALLYGVLILPIFLAGSSARGRPRSGLLAVSIALCAAMALTTLLTLPVQMAAWREQAVPARLVWDFKRQHDRYQTRLLVDFPVLQAFYDYETVVVYNRLPVWMVFPNLEERFYPRNKELVARAIAGGLEYAVITRESLENVTELAHMAGRELVEVESNERYRILRIR